MHARRGHHCEQSNPLRHKEVMDWIVDQEAKEDANLGRSAP
jgi:hypothetical protein